MKLPPSLRTNKTAIALVEKNDRQRSALAELRQQVSDPKNRLIRDGLAIQGGAFAAGVADGAMPRLGPADPSLVGGLLTAGAAIATGSTTLASAANGMLAGQSYKKGMATGMAMKVKFAESGS